jgi:hypothetical protein
MTNKLTPEEIAAILEKTGKENPNLYEEESEWQESLIKNAFDYAMNKRLSSRQLYQMAHKSGIKEVVDWVNKEIINQYIGADDLVYRQWVDQLKEWGL